MTGRLRVQVRFKVTLPKTMMLLNGEIYTKCELVKAAEGEIDVSDGVFVCIVEV